MQRILSRQKSGSCKISEASVSISAPASVSVTASDGLSSLTDVDIVSQINSWLATRVNGCSLGGSGSRRGLNLRMTTLYAFSADLFSCIQRNTSLDLV